MQPWAAQVSVRVSLQASTKMFRVGFSQELIARDEGKSTRATGIEAQAPKD